MGRKKSKTSRRAPPGESPVTPSHEEQSCSSHGSATTVDPSAETVPYVPTIGMVEPNPQLTSYSEMGKMLLQAAELTPSSSSSSIRVTQPPSKESLGTPVLDLTSSSSSVDDISKHRMISPMDSVPLMHCETPTTQVLHCKGVLYSRLPYDILREYTPLVDEELDGCKADWVSIGAMLLAATTHSGRIRETGKKDKLIQQVPALERQYAVGKLTELLMQWVSQGSDPQQTPRVLLVRTLNDEWCYPGGVYNLSKVDETTLHRNGCPHLNGYTLARWVTKQTGLQTSYAEWQHINTTEDSAGHLGLSPNLTFNQPVLQMVYSKEVLIATPRKSKTTEPNKVARPTAQRKHHSDSDESFFSDITEEDDGTKSTDEAEEEPHTHRYVTCILHSAEPKQKLQSLTTRDGFEASVMWVPLKRYLSALRSGTLYSYSEDRDEAVELLRLPFAQY